jgi:hypothetical protein
VSAYSLVVILFVTVLEVLGGRTTKRELKALTCISYTPPLTAVCGT